MKKNSGFSGKTIGIVCACFLLVALTFGPAVVRAATDIYSVSAVLTGNGTATFGGADSASVAAGSSVELTVTPDPGWFVDSVLDSEGTALSVAEAGGKVSYTPAADDSVITVSFRQYAALYESADGKEVVYTKTLSAAASMAKDDADRITMLRDVALNDDDSLGSVYRLQVEQGFVLDLNGKVLSADYGLLRFLNKSTDKVSTVTLKNGTLVAAQKGDSQHMIAIMNKGSLVLENVQAYNGAFYTDGQITVNEDEVNKSSKGVSAVAMCNGSGDIYITDSFLCTYGNYYVFNTNNTDTSLDMCELFLTNSHLKTYGAKIVINNSDKRGYKATFLDGKTVLTTALADNGAFHEKVEPVPFGGFAFGQKSSYTEDGNTFYDYGHIINLPVTWVDGQGNVLEEDVVVDGATPEYNGVLPEKAADANNTYVFAGWTPEIAPATQPVTYTAVFKAAPADYGRVTLDLAEDAGLYRVQGRPYLAEDGLYMDFAGAAIEFEAAFAGGLTITYDAQESVYLEVAVDGVAGEWVYLPEGKGQTVILEKFVTPGIHQVRIVRDSDVSTKGYRLKVCSVAFTGKAETVKPTAERQLYIEFVGDSITSGKYTVMENVEGVGIHKATNSYAYQVAQLLDADYSMVSRGGCGFFRVSSCPVPAHKIYPYYNGFLSDKVEYAAQRKADVVVLALGTNDTKASVETSYADGIVPFDTFVKAPRYVIGQIRQMHGENVKIVVMQNMMSGSWEAELREAAEAEGVYFLKVTQNRAGGNNHPSAEGHRVIAGELKAFLEETVLADVKVCGGENGQEGKSYCSLQAAVDALEAGQYIRLVENTVGDAVISGDVYIDLNGFTLTGNLSGTGTLYGMDTTGDKYTQPKGGIAGSITCNVAGNFKTAVTGAVKRYVAIADDKGYTFHRIYLGITHISVRPVVDGVGYKAVFAADDAVRALLAKNEAYGFTLWVGEDGTKHSFAKDISTFRSGKGVSLWLQNFDVANYGQTQVYGRVFLKFADGTVIESAVQDYTLRGMMELLAANEAEFTAVQRIAVRAMVARFADAMKDWLIDPLR